MRPELLEKILELVEGGATVLGQRPVESPSLSGYPSADAEVIQLAAAIWGDLDGISRTVRYVDDGMVFYGRTPEETLARMNVTPDFAWGGGTVDAELSWLHRRDGDTDIYFIANLTDSSQDLEAAFRVAGREAEYWHPDDGSIEPASYRSDGERTIVPMDLAPREMVFVVFPRDAQVTTRTVPKVVETPAATIDGSWQVSFQPGLGAPDAIMLGELAPWADHVDEGVRYLSGTATYTKSFDVPRQWLASGMRVLLDLGDVADMADVTVNGESFGLLWQPPFRVDITNALDTGRNELAIEITNQWNNRIAGDRAVPAEQRVLSEVGGGRGGPGGGAAPNVPDSGLLGPVTIVLQTATIN
jgi:hypothetical protein